MGTLTTIRGRELTPAERALDERAKEANDRHYIISLAVNGLDADAIVVRAAKRANRDGGPLLLTEAAVQKVIDTYLERLARVDAEAIERLRALENRRLDYLLERLEKEVKKGSPSAVRAALAVSERRAKMNGLDAPRKILKKVERMTVDPEQVRREEEAFRTQHAIPVEAEDVEIGDPDPGREATSG